MRGIGAFLRAALAAGVLAACSDSTGSSPELGTFSGSWNGNAWSGNAFAVLANDSLTVVAHYRDPKHFYDEVITARVRFTGPGTYAVVLGDGELQEIVGGDAGLFARSEGTLTVESYDAAARSASGTLALHSEAMPTAWSASGTFSAPVLSRYPNVW
jgi:hypothetical protein